MDVLLIIDMQEGSFVNNDKHDLEGVVSRINALAAHVRAGGGRVVFILHDGDESIDLVPHTPGWRVLSSLAVRDDDLSVRKTTNDSFYRTNLQSLLDDLGCERLIISGWSTDQCVDSTVRAAISRDFKVVVAADCHTVRDRPGITARQVIDHHNGIWRHLLTPDEPVSVLPAAAIMNQEKDG